MLKIYEQRERYMRILSQQSATTDSPNTVTELVDATGHPVHPTSKRPDDFHQQEYSEENLPREKYSQSKYQILDDSANVAQSSPAPLEPTAVPATATIAVENRHSKSSRELLQAERSRLLALQYSGKSYILAPPGDDYVPEPTAFVEKQVFQEITPKKSPNEIGTDKRNSVVSMNGDGTKQQKKQISSAEISTEKENPAIVSSKMKSVEVPSSSSRKKTPLSIIDAKPIAISQPNSGVPPAISVSASTLSSSSKDNSARPPSLTPPAPNLSPRPSDDDGSVFGSDSSTISSSNKKKELLKTGKGSPDSFMSVSKQEPIVIELRTPKFQPIVLKDEEKDKPKSKPKSPSITPKKDLSPRPTPTTEPPTPGSGSSSKLIKKRKINVDGSSTTSFNGNSQNDYSSNRDSYQHANQHNGTTQDQYGHTHSYDQANTQLAGQDYWSNSYSEGTVGTTASSEAYDQTYSQGYDQSYVHSYDENQAYYQQQQPTTGSDQQTTDWQQAYDNTSYYADPATTATTATTEYSYDETSYYAQSNANTSNGDSSAYSTTTYEGYEGYYNADGTFTYTSYSTEAGASDVVTNEGYASAAAVESTTVIASEGTESYTESNEGYWYQLEDGSYAFYRYDQDQTQTGTNNVDSNAAQENPDGSSTITSYATETVAADGAAPEDCVSTVVESTITENAADGNATTEGYWYQCEDGSYAFYRYDQDQTQTLANEVQKNAVQENPDGSSTYTSYSTEAAAAVADGITSEGYLSTSAESTVAVEFPETNADNNATTEGYWYQLEDGSHAFYRYDQDQAQTATNIVESNVLQEKPDGTNSTYDTEVVAADGSTVVESSIAVDSTETNATAEGYWYQLEDGSYAFYRYDQDQTQTLAIEVQKNTALEQAEAEAQPLQYSTMEATTIEEGEITTAEQNAATADSSEVGAATSTTEYQAAQTPGYYTADGTWVHDPYGYYQEDGSYVYYDPSHSIYYAAADGSGEQVQYETGGQGTTLASDPASSVVNSDAVISEVTQEAVTTVDAYETSQTSGEFQKGYYQPHDTATNASDGTAIYTEYAQTGQAGDSHYDNAQAAYDGAYYGETSGAAYYQDTTVQAEGPSVGTTGVDQYGYPETSDGTTVQYAGDAATYTGYGYEGYESYDQYQYQQGSAATPQASGDVTTTEYANPVATSTEYYDPTAYTAYNYTDQQVDPNYVQYAEGTYQDGNNYNTVADVAGPSEYVYDQSAASATYDNTYEQSGSADMSARRSLLRIGNGASLKMNNFLNPPTPVHNMVLPQNEIISTSNFFLPMVKFRALSQRGPAASRYGNVNAVSRSLAFNMQLGLMQDMILTSSEVAIAVKFPDELYDTVVSYALVASRTKAPLRSPCRRFFVISSRRKPIEESSSLSDRNENAVDIDDFGVHIPLPSFLRSSGQQIKLKVQDLCEHIEFTASGELEIALSDVDDAPLSTTELQFIERHIKEPFKHLYNDSLIQQKGCSIKNCRKLFNRLSQM